MNKKRLPFLLIGTGIFLLTSLLYHFHLLDSWQEKIIDRFFITEQPDSSIVIVAIDDESLRTIGQWPWKREVFASLLPHLKNAKTVGIDVSFSEPSREGEQDDALLAEALAHLSETTTVVLPLQLSVRGDVLNKPLASFTEKTQMGYVNIPLERDGIARETTNTIGTATSFAHLLAMDASTIPSIYRIQYQGKAGTFTTIPLSDVLSGAVPESIITGKTVLIGVTATDLHDFVETPFGAMPGVEVHANSINTIRHHSYPREIPSTASHGTLLALTLLGVLLVTRIRRLSILLGSLSLLFILSNTVALLSFSYHLILPVLYLNLALLSSAGLSILVQYIFESDEKRRIRTAFQYYLTPKVIDELLAHPEKLSLGGEKRKMTILFSDIADFTSISERLSPTELTSLMNEYLTAMTNIISERNGVVDKYIGDAIMAFWGAPLEDSEQALRACESAREMMHALTKLNTEWRSRGISEIRARIGIATGDVVVGNMGSQSRFNYTVMGDTVNFASRLEGINKTYSTSCIVSEETKNNAPTLAFREIDMVRVKGKKEANRIFELLFESQTEDRKKLYTFFEEGYRAYHRGDWSVAVSAFGNALSIAEDGPSSVLLERAVRYRHTPPTDWDGVYIFDTK